MIKNHLLVGSVVGEASDINEGNRSVHKKLRKQENP